jgi:hypothetical protein
MEVIGQFRTPATLLLGKETLPPIELEPGHVRELVWMLWILNCDFLVVQLTA